MDELTEQQCVELLQRSAVGHLAVLDDDMPYVTPVSYVMVNGHLGMRVGPGRRVDAIRKHDLVCFETSTYDEQTGDWQSVVVEGRATLITGGRRAEDVIAGLLGKYRNVVSALQGTPAALGREMILILEPTRITGRSSGSFFAVRTRPGRL